MSTKNQWAQYCAPTKGSNMKQTINIDTLTEEEKAFILAQINNEMYVAPKKGKKSKKPVLPHVKQFSNGVSIKADYSRFNEEEIVFSIKTTPRKRKDIYMTPEEFNAFCEVQEDMADFMNSFID